MKVDVLGIPFENVTLSEACGLCRNAMGTTGGYAVTANPEILLRCREDGTFAGAVRGADHVFADGVGVLKAAAILKTPLRERVTGADLVPLLLRTLAERNGSVFLFGARPGVAEQAARRLAADYPGLRIAGTENGYISDYGELLAALKAEKPDLLLVGLGAPRQELWMEAHRAELAPTFMIGVGGCLDLFAGNVRRAPEIFQKTGTEWLFRLLQEPKRITRMIRLPEILLWALRERK